jgi:hypothetical protein
MFLRAIGAAMTKYASIHHHVTLFGDMFGGNEIWTTGFSLGQTNGGDEDQAPTEAEAQAIAEAFRSMWVLSTNSFSSSYRFTGVKVAHVNTLGKSDTALTRFYNLPTQAAGPTTSNTPLAQAALVVTLQTLKQRGRGSKGRMYLPGLAEPVGTDGKLATTNVTRVANQMKIFFDAVNASAAVPGVVVLNSAEVAGTPYKAPEMNRVASVKVGNVVDTQRRRRNKLVEQYQLATLA